MMSMMKKIMLSMLIMVTLCIGFLKIANVNKVEGDTLTSLTFIISIPDIKIEYTNNFTLIIIKNASYTQKPGDPMIPVLKYIVAVPLSSRIENIKVSSIENYTMVLEKPVIPYPKPVLICSCNNREIRYSQYNLSVYPSDILVDSRLLPFRGIGLLTLSISPLFYYPTNNTILVIKKIKLTLTLSYDIEGIVRRDTFIKNLKHLPNVLNIDVSSIPIKKLPVAKRVALDLGSLSSISYDEVIIAPANWSDALKPLIDWKFKKGIPTYLATLEWIDLNYNGIDLAQKIRNFIKDAFNTWQITKVLLIGDANIVPVRYIFNPDTDEGGWINDNTYKPTDRYYGGLSIDALYNSDDGWYAYSGDYGWGWGYNSTIADDGKDHIQWSQDVIVSRIPVSTEIELTDYINKLLHYEKAPNIGNWTNRMLLIGAILDTYSATSSAEYKEALRTNVLKNNMSYYKLYNLDGTNTNLTRTDFVNAINSSGVSLTEWFAHGGTYLASDQVYNGASWQWYDFALASDALSMSNNDTLTFIFAYSCLTNAFDAAEYGGITYNDYSLGEAFIRNANGGAIGYIGWSRVTWGYLGPYLDLGGGESIDTYFWIYFFTTGNHTPGLSLFQSLNRYGMYYQSNAEWRRKVYTSVHLLGDLDTSIWTNVPLLLNASHPENVYVNSNINVTTEPYSMVTLYNPDTGFYARKYADANGVAVFQAPNETMILEITVTKYGYIPYESTIAVSYPPTFWIELNTTRVEIWRGKNATVEVYVKANEIVGNVTLSANTTAWLLAGFNPSSGTPNYTSILTLTVMYDAPIGNYTLEIKGDNGTTYTTTYLDIVIQDFNISLERDKITILSNYTVLFNAYVESLNGFNGLVNLSYILIPDSPSIQVSLNPDSGYAPYTSTVNITTVNATEGNYSLIIIATREDGKTKEREVQVTVVESVNIYLELESVKVVRGVIEVNFTVWCEEDLPITTAEYYINNSFVGYAEPQDGKFDEAVENATIYYDAKYLDDGFHSLSFRGKSEDFYSDWLNLTIHVRTLHKRYSIVALVLSPIGQYKASDMAKAIGSNLTGIWKWDINSQDFIAYIPGVTGEDFEIIIGEGYFVYMNDEAKWVEVGMP